MPTENENQGAQVSGVPPPTACSPSVLDRFARVFAEMDAEIIALKKENADLASKLRAANFPTQQATNCGKCGEYKHTPWKDDDYGFVCATCLVAIKDAQIEALKENISGHLRTTAGRT